MREGLVELPPDTQYTTLSLLMAYLENEVRSCKRLLKDAGVVRACQTNMD